MIDITNFLLPELDTIDVSGLWFQQDELAGPRSRGYNIIFLLIQHLQEFLKLPVSHIVFKIPTIHMVILRLNQGIYPRNIFLYIYCSVYPRNMFLCIYCSV